MFLPYCLRNRVSLNSRCLVAEGFPPLEAHPNKRTLPAGSNEPAGPPTYKTRRRELRLVDLRTAMPLPDLPVAMLELTAGS